MKLRHSHLLAAAVVLGLALATPVAAQVKPAEKASSMTQAQGDAILKELRQIRQLLEKMVKADSQRAAQPAPSTEGVKVQIGESPTLGSPTAPLTMVEFTDYQCFFCRQFYLNSFGELKKNFIDTGKLRYVVRDFPLSFHEGAMKAAQAAHCADAQGQYWPMRNALISNQSNLGQEALLEYAQGLKLDMSRFRTCLTSGDYVAEIQRSMEDANIIEIPGTPSFVLGLSTPDGVTGVKFEGALSYAAVEAKINGLLAKTRLPDGQTLVH
jgi:protein-disulfide isomerase